MFSLKSGKILGLSLSSLYKNFLEVLTNAIRSETISVDIRRMYLYFR